MLLNSDEIDRVPQKVPGVYLLHLFAPERLTYPIFYAGKTWDLHRRLAEHLSDNKAKASIWCLRHDHQAYFSAAPITNLSLLDRVEAGLIRGLRPPCNDQIPAVPPIYVNLPPLHLFSSSNYEKD